MPRPITRLVIHCSATPNGRSLFVGKRGDADFKTPAQVIDGWHAARHFRRDPAACKRFNPGLQAIGYHYVIYLNGAVATGRHEDEIGAHAQGFNRSSLGICLVGTDRFTIDQWSALTHLVSRLHGRFPEVAVCGHRDLPTAGRKTCPGFAVRRWMDAGMVSEVGHVL